MPTRSTAFRSTVSFARSGTGTLQTYRLSWGTPRAFSLVASAILVTWSSRDSICLAHSFPCTDTKLRDACQEGARKQCHLHALALQKLLLTCRLSGLVRSEERRVGK